MSGCGATLDNGHSCTVQITFTPTAEGARSGTLTITDDGGRTPGNMQIVSLTGTGTAPAASLSPPSLAAFAGQNVGTASSAQKVTLSNTGNAPLAVASVAISGTDGGDFSEANTCGGSVAAGAGCTVSIVFKPAAAGSRTGMLTITDNSNGEAGSTQSVSLSGTGVAPEVALAPGSVSFGALDVGTASTGSTVTLTNSGNAALTITSVAISGADAKDFAMGSGSTCSTKAAVAGGKSCTVSLTFTPSAAGSRSATLTITDNANDAASANQTVALSGTGKDFTLAAFPAASIPPGQSATSTLTLTPQSGFSGTVQVMWSEPSGLNESSCTVAPNSVTLNGSSAAQVQVTVSTTAPSMSPAVRRRPQAGPYSPLGVRPVRLAIAAMLAGLLLFYTRSGRRRGWAALVLAVLAVLMFASCGGGCGSQGNPAPRPAATA